MKNAFQSKQPIAPRVTPQVLVTCLNNGQTSWGTVVEKTENKICVVLEKTQVKLVLKKNNLDAFELEMGPVRLASSGDIYEKIEIVVNSQSPNPVYDISRLLREKQNLVDTELNLLA